MIIGAKGVGFMGSAGGAPSSSISAYGSPTTITGGNYPRIAGESDDRVFLIQSGTTSNIKRYQLTAGTWGITNTWNSNDEGITLGIGSVTCLGFGVTSKYATLTAADGHVRIWEVTSGILSLLASVDTGGSVDGGAIFWNNFNTFSGDYLSTFDTYSGATGTYQQYSYNGTSSVSAVGSSTAVVTGGYAGGALCSYGPTSPSSIVSIAVGDKYLTFYNFNGSAWSTVGNPYFVDVKNLNFTVALVCLTTDRFLLAYTDSSNNTKLSVFSWNGTDFILHTGSLTIGTSMAHLSLARLTSTRVVFVNNTDMVMQAYNVTYS